MSNGAHVLEIASFIVAGGVLESARSAPLRVTVAGIAPRRRARTYWWRDRHDGRRRPAARGSSLRRARRTHRAGVAPDGRAFVGTNSGLLVVNDDARAGPAQLTDGRSWRSHSRPRFDRDGHVYVTQAVPSEAGIRFRTARYRDFGGRLAQRMVLLENGPAATAPAAALRIGPDGKLYAAFDDGGSAAAAERMSEWSGKLLRMEPDGRTPEDQAAASPVLFAGLTSPRGFDWAPDGRRSGLPTRRATASSALRVIATTSERPRRAGQRGTFTMPRGLGAAAVAFYRGDAIREFSGDLLIAGRDGGISCASASIHRIASSVSTERLLDGRLGSVRALTVGPDGAIYFCTDTTLIRLIGVP